MLMPAKCPAFSLSTGTAEEMMAGKTAGEGCDFDRHLCWTSTHCSPSASPTASPSVSPTNRPCDASEAPLNGGVGSCTNSLASGADPGPGPGSLKIH